MTTTTMLCSLAIRSLLASAAWLKGDAVVVAFSPFFSFSTRKIPPPSPKMRRLHSNNNDKFIPPAFTVIEDDNDKDNSDFPSSKQRSRRTSPPEFIIEDYEENSETSNDFSDDSDEERRAAGRGRIVRPTRPKNIGEGASWMTRNAKFDTASSSTSSFDSDQERIQQQPQRRPQQRQPRNNGERPQQRDGRNRNSRDTVDGGGGGGGNKTFRQDFRGTRVFVDGLPPHATWQNLKDHFRDDVLSSSPHAVVFASISTDPVTGASKGHGIVQFETTELAARAIALSSNVPFQDKYPPLFVRPDRQQKGGGDDDDDNKQLKNNIMPQRQNRGRESFDGSRPNNSNTGNTGLMPPSPLHQQRPHADWVCADEENASSYLLGDEDRQAVLNLLAARNDARRRRNYDVSDNIRQELKEVYGVHLDDRLHTWWTSRDGKHVPQTIRDIRGGDGRWGNSNKQQKQQQPWRQIPTTPESDALVNSDLVNALLQQRDIARLERDFATADALLEEARAAPDDDDLYLRIHDESRTWRIWTPEPPPPPVPQKPTTISRIDHDKSKSQRLIQSPGEQCIALVQEHAPNRVGEIKLLLEKFVGREYQILKKLKSRYTSESL